MGGCFEEGVVSWCEMFSCVELSLSLSLLDCQLIIICERVCFVGLFARIGLPEKQREEGEKKKKKKKKGKRKDGYRSRETAVCDNDYQTRIHKSQDATTFNLCSV